MIYDTEIVYVIIVLYFFLLYIKSLHVKSVCIEDEKEKKKKKPGVCVCVCDTAKKNVCRNAIYFLMNPDLLPLPIQLEAYVNSH